MLEGQLSHLIGAANKGEKIALDAIYRLAFPRLRAIASGLLRRERRGHTLQPTALVSELFLKLRRVEIRLANEEHFFAVSARAMKQVLVDYSRIKSAQKTIPPSLIDALSPKISSAAEAAEMSHTIQQVFDQLHALDPRASASVWLRCVEGLSWEEASRVQSRAVWSVRADYDFGVAWMRARLTNGRAH